MDKFLETYNLPKLNQEESENLNRQVTTNEITFLDIYLFIFRERRQDGEREGEKQCVIASHVSPPEDLAHSLGMCPDWDSNQQPFVSQACIQSTEPHQPGQQLMKLKQEKKRKKKKNPPIKQKFWARCDFTGEFYQTLKELTPIFLKLFKTIQEEGRLPNTIYEAKIILIPKPDKDTTKRENYRLISLMNIHTKILNKILENQIHKYIKNIIQHDQVGFILGIEGWYNIANQLI